MENEVISKIIEEKRGNEIKRIINTYNKIYKELDEIMEVGNFDLVKIKTALEDEEIKDITNKIKEIENLIKNISDENKVYQLVKYEIESDNLNFNIGFYKENKKETVICESSKYITIFKLFDEKFKYTVIKSKKEEYQLSIYAIVEKDLETEKTTMLDCSIFKSEDIN